MVPLFGGAKHLCNFGRRHHEEQFCEIFNLDQWFRRQCHLKISYLELWWPFCSADRNHLCNFGRGHYEEHFCEIIFNLNQWFKGKWRYKKFFDLELWWPLNGGVDLFVQFW